TRLSLLIGLWSTFLSVYFLNFYALLFLLDKLRAITNSANEILNVE
ncbi:MAG: hypothetical protein ACJARN_001179, partial [Arenicella sp.]